MRFSNRFQASLQCVVHTNGQTKLRKEFGGQACKYLESKFPEVASRAITGIRCLRPVITYCVHVWQSETPGQLV